METYNFDSELNEGKFKNNPVTVREAFEKDPKIIFNLIKKYKYSFSDDVLEAAHIKKIVKDVAYSNIIVDKDPVKPSNKVYKKDKKSLDDILDEMFDEHMNIKDDYEDTNSSYDEELNNIEMPVDPEI